MRKRAGSILPKLRCDADPKHLARTINDGAKWISSRSDFNSRFARQDVSEANEQCAAPGQANSTLDDFTGDVGGEGANGVDYKSNNLGEYRIHCRDDVLS